MTGTDERDLDLVRKSARELARRFDLGDRECLISISPNTSGPATRS